MAHLRERPPPPPPPPSRPRGTHWTVVEDIAFIEALNGGACRFGDWELIAGFVGTRTAEQVERRAINLLRREQAASDTAQHLAALLKEKRSEAVSAKRTTLLEEKDSDHRPSGAKAIKQNAKRIDAAAAAAETTGTANAKAAQKPSSQDVAKRMAPEPKRTYARRSRIGGPSLEHVSITDDSSTSASASRSTRLSTQSIDIMQSSSSKARTSTAAGTSQKALSESPSEGSQKINSPPLKPIAIPKDSVLDLSLVQDYEIEACPTLFKGKRQASPAVRLAMYKILRRRFLKMWQERRPSPLNLDDLRAFKAHSADARAEVHALLCALQVINNPDAPEFAIESEESSAAGRDADADADAETEMLRSLASATTARRRKVRGEEGEWLSQEELQGRTIAHESPKEPSTPKRSRRTVKKQLEPAAEGEDPFQLVLMSDYAQSAEEAKTVLQAPLRVEVSSAAIVVMDLHAHLHQSEIIGLLGGSITSLPSDDASGSSQQLVTVSTAYPCKRQHSSGTEVDVDPLSEMEAGEFFESQGQRLVGWYHSHPNFEPNPSVRDLETQAMYQALVGLDDPFVGVIVNPWDAFSHPNSHIECFHVVRNPEGGNEELLPYRLPLAISTSNVPDDRDHLHRFVERVLAEAQESADQVDLTRRSGRGFESLRRSEKLLQSLRHHGMLDESDHRLLNTLHVWIKEQHEDAS